MLLSIQGWMKVLGAACILWGAAGTGIWFAGRYKQRIQELEQLKQMLFLLKGQILYASAPLPEALETVGKRVDGILGKLFQETAASLQQQPGDPFPVIWKRCVSEISGHSALSKMDMQALQNLGDHLGFLDRETQERTLLLYLEQVDAQLEVLREHRQERCRLYTSLGVMGGLFLAVILI